MSFRLKVVLGIVLTMLIGVAVGVTVSTQQITRVGLNGLRDKSSAILSRAEAVKNFVAIQGGFKLAADKAVLDYPDGNIPEHVKKEIVNHVPVFAAMKVAGQDAEKEHYKFRVFSDEPRNKDNQATSKEMEIFNQFAKDASIEELVVESDETMTLYRPIRVYAKNGCMTCHGDPATSPFKNGKDILGYKMENWSDGKLHAVYSIISQTAPVREATVKSSLMILGFSILGGLFSIVIGYLIIKTPIARLSTATEDLAKMGQSVRSASQEIASSSDSLSGSSAEAAASIEETTASTEEVASMIKLNSENAKTARDLSQESEEQAKKGAEQVEKLISAMEEISKSSVRIEEITSVIDDIAFQTNLLALNAAVEAARAGEQGRGFAVVAEAVRTLAQRSSSSAKEISDLIKDSVNKVRNGTELAHKSGEYLSEIVKSVEKVSSLNSEISKASTEQDAGLSNINKAVIEMDKVTQENAREAQTTAHSSKKLSGQAEKLYQLVDELQIILHGLKRGQTQIAQTSKSSNSDDFFGDSTAQAKPQVNIKSVGSFDQAS